MPVVMCLYFDNHHHQVWATRLFSFLTNMLCCICTSLCLIVLKIISLRFRIIFAFFTFTYTMFPQTLLLLTQSDTHTHTQSWHSHLRPYVEEALPGKVIAREKKLWRVSYLFRCHWGAPLLPSIISLFLPFSLSPSLLFPLALSNHARLQWYSDSPRTK